MFHLYTDNIDHWNKNVVSDINKKTPKWKEKYVVNR